MRDLYYSLCSVFVEAGLGDEGVGRAALYLSRVIDVVHSAGFSTYADDARFIIRVLEKYIERDEDERAVDSMLKGYEKKLRDIEDSELPARIALMYSGKAHYDELEKPEIDFPFDEL